MLSWYYDPPANIGAATSPAAAEIKISDLEFTDDTLTNTLDESSDLCQRIADTAALYSLLFNLSKTKCKYMVYIKPSIWYSTLPDP